VEPRQIKFRQLAGGTFLGVVVARIPDV